MQYVVYNFEAKSIQKYVLATNKLKDRVAGSQQIESLCDSKGLLDQLLAHPKINLKDKVLFARKTGGAFIAILNTSDIKNAHQKAKEIQAIWTFTVQKLMPGLHFNQGIGGGGSITEAVKSAFENQHQSQLYPDLPLANPFTIYSQRSGKVATHLKYFKKSDQYEFLDATTQLKRDLIDDIKKGNKPDLLIEKLNLEDPNIHWPSIMPEDDENKEENTDNEDVFPFENEDHTIGILHADINNLGSISLEFAKKLTDDNDDNYQEVTKDFSDAIEKAVNKAVKIAINNLKDKIEPNENGKKIMPARPLVLAGDDITFILRGDIALEFSQILVSELEKTTEEEITNLQNKHKDIPKLPTHMTACAGIAYIKASQPFYQGYKLSDSLCEWAKHHSKKRAQDNKLDIVPTSIAYHRITTSMIDDYPTIVRNELTTENNLLLSHQPYFLGSNNETPRLEDLLKLKSALQEIGHGQLRPLLDLLYEGESQANKAFERWCTVMDKKGKKYQKLKLEIIKNLLKLVNKDYLTNKKDTEFTSFSEKKRDEKDDSLFYRYTSLADCISLTQIHPVKQDPQPETST